MIRASLLLLMVSGAAMAESLVPTRTIRAGEILSEADLAYAQVSVLSGFTKAAALTGLEARTTLYAGRPIRQGDVGRPALVDRNQKVKVEFRSGALAITDEARALGRAGFGELVQVMSLRSRTTVTALVVGQGRVRVQQ